MDCRRSVHSDATDVRGDDSGVKNARASDRRYSLSSSSSASAIAATLARATPVPGAALLSARAGRDATDAVRAGPTTDACFVVVAATAAASALDFLRLGDGARTSYIDTTYTFTRDLPALARGVRVSPVPRRLWRARAYAARS